jgi:hypothetical protein
MTVGNIHEGGEFGADLLGSFEQVPEFIHLPVLDRLDRERELSFALTTKEARFIVH